MEAVISRRFVAAALALALMLCAVLRAEQPKPLDYEVKAVYLLNFGRFVTWPRIAGAAQDEVFGLCVLGRDPFGSFLDTTIAGETVDGHPVVARRVTKPQDAVGCHILFIGASEGNQLAPILQALGRARTLTVSDMPRFADQGGMIQFLSDGNRVRFAVNVKATEQAGLTLSSELLKVAVAVKTGKPGA